MVDFLRIQIAARFAKMEERGASAVEYGLLIAGIAAVVIAGVFLLGPVVDNMFSDVASEITQDPNA
jgi:pilus assembly protein Flp/PilA